ncbi:hypothetical protein MTO96_049253 [Rhipicephalus appendiculatus]
MPVENDTDKEEEDDDSAAWIAGQPSDIPVSIVEDPPTYSGKLNADCSACDAFSLYFDEEVWKMIVEKTNLYALQEMTPNWQALTSIADSETGYFCKFDLYQGRTERRPTDKGLDVRSGLLTTPGMASDVTQFCPLVCCRVDVRSGLLTTPGMASDVTQFCPLSAAE